MLQNSRQLASNVFSDCVAPLQLVTRWRWNASIFLDINVFSLSAVWLVSTFLDDVSEFRKKSTPRSFSSQRVSRFLGHPSRQPVTRGKLLSVFEFSGKVFRGLCKFAPFQPDRPVFEVTKLAHTNMTYTLSFCSFAKSSWYISFAGFFHP